MRPTAENLPHDATADDYIEHVRLALAVGRSIIAPANREQLEALMEFNPSLGRRHLPVAKWLPMMELPEWYGRIEPFDEEWQERFLLTLKEDEEFRIAVRHFLNGGGT